MKISVTSTDKFYILDFVEDLILDLEERIRENKDDTYWREEYGASLEYMQDAYNQLEAKEGLLQNSLDFRGFCQSLFF